MLTRKHLAVLRAAMQYFDEELVPHGMDAMRPYLNETLEGEITPVDIRELQQFLRDIDLRYAVVNPFTKQAIPTVLYPSVDEATGASSEPSQRLAVVLIPQP